MRLNELCKNLAIECSSNQKIIGLNTLKDANAKEVTFLENKKYLKDLENTKAAAVFIKKEFQHLLPSNTLALICEEPYIELAHASKYFAAPLVDSDGKEALIGKNTVIMKGANLGRNVIIGSSCTVFPGAYIGDNVRIGDNTIIQANVVIYRDCTVGDDCLIHSGAIIGADGFGFANNKGKYIKIYQNGNVSIGNDVEIGANTTIDRAAFKSTIIHDGARIDNLIQIAHNCIIGPGCILTAQIGLAGSTVLNEYVIMGAQSGTAGHLEIAPFTTISARAGVTKSIKVSKKQWAGFPLMEHRSWLRLQGKISKLLKG